MEKFLRHQKLLVLVPMVALCIYAVGYLVLAFTGNFIEHHHTFLSSVLMILSLNFLYFAFVHHNRLMQWGAWVVFFAVVIDLFYELTFSHQLTGMSLILVDALIHLAHIVGILLLSYGLYQSMTASRKRHVIFREFFNYNNSVYFEYHRSKQIITFMFSNSFRAKTNLHQERMAFPLDEAIKQMDSADQKQFKDMLYHPEKHLASEIKLRVQLPGMAEPVLLFTKIIAIITDSLSGILIDISHLEELVIELNLSKEAFEQKEYEEKAILESTNDIIVKFRYDGKLMFSTENYAKFFNYSKEELMKMSVENLDDTIGFSKEQWFIDVVNDGYSESIVEWNTDGKTKWIYWKNRALYNEDDELEAILSVGHDITDLKRLNNELYQKSLHDDLTQFYNRSGLIDKIQTLETKPSVVLFYLGLDNYSYINDFYGYEVGDQIIKDVALELDWFGQRGAIVARISRDEFVIIAHEPPIIQECLLHIYRFLESQFSIQGVSISIKKNIGYAIYPDDSKTVKGLLSLASLAMLESKSHYHHTALRYRKEFQMNVQENLTMASAIRNAIQNNEIDVFFQSVVHSQTQRIISLEALARWKRSDDTFVSPLVLFQHANRLKLVEDLDRFLIDKALRYFKSIHHQAAYQQATLSINVSPGLLLDSKLIDFFKYEISKYAIGPELIVIEIPENTFVGNLEQIYDQIRKLRQIGMKIAIDDFGREYSSLSVLTAIDFDLIKIDRFFIEHINKPINKEIIQMILRIAKTNNKTVIAEGIETKDQSDKLIEYGCIYHQGYYYARPKKLV